MSGQQREERQPDTSTPAAKHSRRSTSFTPRAGVTPISGSVSRDVSAMEHDGTLDIERVTKQLQEVKEEFATYKREKGENEK